ncbi:MAG TPA: hypothetical protein VHO84_05590 [Syntrophorhabdaceae bacterium]|nr:hypothetical protein [Syntrophorhabdaceae bacterium]
MRVACVYVPHFYLQIEELRNPVLKNRPVVLAAMPEEKGFVLDCSEVLIRRGVAPQMSLRDASHLCFDAVPIFVQRRDYVQIWDNILSTVAGITLRMEPKDPGVIFLDITRLPCLYRSEEQIASALVQLVNDHSGLKTTVGIGNSRFLAFEAASSAPRDVNIVRTGTERKFLSSVGVAHLPVSEDVLKKLRLFGLNRLGQIASFTLSALTSQFGAAGKIMWEIANGIGDQDRIPCVFPVTDVDKSLVCDTPVYSKDQMKIALLELLDNLCLELEELGKACRTIRLICDLQNKGFIEKQFFLSPPTAHKEDMLRRIMTNFEQVTLPSPIQLMSVRASSLVNYSGQQEKLFRLRNGISKKMADMRGLLKTKYSSIPLGRVIENNTNTLLPDDKYVFVDP